MNQMEFSVPCLFGLEGLAGDELRRLNIENVRVENGRVLFSARTFSMFSRRSSSPARPSSPKRQGTENSI